MSGLLSRPGLFTGTEQNNRNENSLNLKHLQACTLYFFFPTRSLSDCLLFPHTLMAGCLKATAGSWWGGGPLDSRLYCLSWSLFRELHLVAMDTIDRHRIFIFFFFWSKFILLNVESYSFGGYIMLSYRNCLYVVVHSSFYSKLRQDFCACGCISNTHTSDCFLNFGQGDSLRRPMIGKQASGPDAFPFLSLYLLYSLVLFFFWVPSTSPETIFFTEAFTLLS